MARVQACSQLLHITLLKIAYESLHFPSILEIDCCSSMFSLTLLQRSHYNTSATLPLHDTLVNYQLSYPRTAANYQLKLQITQKQSTIVICSHSKVGA